MSYRDIILEILSKHDALMPIDVLKVQVARAAQQPIIRQQFDSDLSLLDKHQAIRIHNNAASRIEADFPEKTLEGPVEIFLREHFIPHILQVQLDQFVLENTTLTGAPDRGPWTRPDFTLATIGQRKYDPHRHLDVHSFELKPRASADIRGVHEALSHARCAHYVYLICPRSELNAQRTQQVNLAAAEHNVGLITFQLEADDQGQPHLHGYRLDVVPRRRATDPYEIERHLDHALSKGGQENLFSLAKGG